MVNHPAAGRRLATVLTLVTALLAFWLVAPPATAKPPVRAAAPAVVSELASDQSTGLPVTQHGEGIGQFTGTWGQRARIEDGYLNVYDPPSRGGGLARSTPTDLEGNADQIDQSVTNGLPVFTDPVVWTPTALFLAGYRVSDSRPVIYRVSPDASCAVESCARQQPNWIYESLPRYGLVLSMAATTIGSTPVLAVGTSNNGIVLLRQSDGKQLGSPYVGCSALQTGAILVLTTAMAFAPPGSSTPGLLSYACFSTSTNGNARSIVFAEDGTTSRPTSWTGGISSAFPVSVAVGRRSGGTLLSAYGFSDGSVIVMNPAVSSPSPLARTTDADNDTGLVDGLTFVDRWDDVQGSTQDLVSVSSTSLTGRVFRFTGGASLAPQPVSPGGGTTTDIAGIRSWFPGYKAGRLQFLNTVTEPLRIDFASSADPGSGCWFGPSVPDGQAFPQNPFRIEGTSRSAIYTIGGLTAGTNGSCATPESDPTGQWSAYVVVTAIRHPQEVTTAKLTLSRAGQLTIKTATTTSDTGTVLGGSLRLTALPQATPSYAGGNWLIGIQGPVPPSHAVPTVKGTRLDPAGVDRPVYRFDVSATQYRLLLRQPARMSASLEPLLVQGLRPGGGGPVDLGYLIPQGQPTRATNGTVTLAPVSFYFQNPENEAPFTGIRVLDADGVNFVVVNLRDLDPGPDQPPAPTPPFQVTVCPTNGSSQTCTGTAVPMANGLDQAPLKVQVFDVPGHVVPVTAGSPYGRVYYRDDRGELLTGLIPTDGSPYVRVSPYAGAYPNDGSVGSAPRPPVNAPVGGKFGYLTTTSTGYQEITATVDGQTSAPLVVTARPFTPQVTQGLTGMQGFHVSGCSDYAGSSYCRIAQASATAPALFHTTDPDTGQIRIGLLFTNLAQSANSSLPLRQTAGAEHVVAANVIDVNSGELSLRSTQGFKSTDTFDSWVVSHGEVIPVRALTVGG